MKDLWIGQVEVLTPPCEFGDTKAFTNVVARADNPTDFANFVGSVCAEYDWSLLRVEECNALSTISGITSEELLDAIERAKEFPEACIFTTLYYYSSKPA